LLLELDAVVDVDDSVVGALGELDTAVNCDRLSPGGTVLP